MAINKIARTFCAMWSFRDDDRIAAGAVDARVETDVSAVIVNPARARSNILFVMSLRRDAGEANVLAQLAHEAFAVLLQIIQGCLHRGCVATARYSAKLFRYFFGFWGRSSKPRNGFSVAGAVFVVA